MGGRQFAVLVAVAFLAVAVIPAMADASEAEAGSTRVSSTTVLWVDVPYTDDLQKMDNELFYKLSSTDKIARWNDYFQTHEGTIPEEDADFQAGETIRVYYVTYSFGITVPIKRGDTITSVFPDNLYGSYGADFLVKVGGSYSFRVTKAVDNYGNDVFCYVEDSDGQVHDLSEGYSGNMKKTEYFDFSTKSLNGPASIYVDVDYVEEGFSHASGSAALYAGICAAVTIAIFGILAYAGMKPRWAK